MNLNDPTEFDSVFDSAEKDQAGFDKWVEGKKSLFEERVVKLVMARFGLSDSLTAVMSDVKDWGGKDARLSFNWFHERWPSFPVRLCTERTVFAHEIAVADLYRRFTTTKMYKAFVAAKEIIPGGEMYNSWGLVFPWSGMGNAVLHNSSFVPCGTRFVKEIGGKHTAYLDQFPEFLDAVAKVWVP